MFTSVAISSWVLLNLVAISGDALISKEDVMRSHEAAQKFLRVFSVTSGNESTAAPDNSTKTNINEGYGGPPKEEFKEKIATFPKTSRLQCSHRCKLNGTCKDVAHKDGHICLLFDQKEKEVTGHMEIIHQGMTSYDVYLSNTIALFYVYLTNRMGSIYITILCLSVCSIFLGNC